MSKQPFAPLSDANVIDTPIAQNQPERMSLLPSSENFVLGDDQESADLRAFVKDNIEYVIRRAKQRRRPLEEEWLEIERMTVMRSDSQKRYHGRSNVYIPVYLRARNTLVSALSRGLFPSDDYMDVEDRDVGQEPESLMDPMAQQQHEQQESTAEEMAQAVKYFIQYELEESAQIKSYIKPFLAQYVDLGNSVLKFGYRTKKQAMRSRGKYVPSPQNPDEMLMALANDEQCEGFYVSVRSVHNVVVYPEWAESQRDIIAEGEYSRINNRYLEDMIRLGRWPERARNAGFARDVDFEYANDEVSRDNISATTSTVDDIPVHARTYPVLELFFTMRLPKRGYSSMEDPETEVPCRAVVVGGEVVLLERNQMMLQKSPYLWARQNRVAGQFYGSGAGRAARGPQYMTNDIANQTNDTAIYGLNPVMLMNKSYMAHKPQPLAPGRVFNVRDINQALKWERPPVDLIQYGMQQGQFWSGWVGDGTGAPNVLQGTGASKAASTATGAQLLQRNALSPLQDQVEDLEVEVMVPLMKAVWSLAQQYRDDEFMARIGGSAIRLVPKDMQGNYLFKYLASSQAVNQQVRSQQVVQLLQIVAPLVPLLQQQGKTIDPTPVLRNLYCDGFGFRGFDDFVKKMPMMPMGQPGMPPGQGAPPEGAGGPPGQQLPAEPPGGRPRSAVEQAAGAVDSQPVPGEAEDFQQMRSVADDLAATYGRG